MNYYVMPPQSVAIKRMKRPGINPVYHFPAVSIFLPFNPKMENKNKLAFLLSKATAKATGVLRKKYPGEMATLVTQKLNAIIKDLNFSTHKVSLAIFVSPVFQKVYYLDMEVEPKVIVNESPQIRDLVKCGKQSLPFYILLLKADKSRVFLSGSNSYVRIMPKQVVEENGINIPGTPSKELLRNEFIHRVDQSLDSLLKYNKLPVMVVGTQKLIRQFKKITRHGEVVIEYLEGDYDGSSFEQLKSMLHYSQTDWQTLKQKYFVSQLEDAAKNNRLTAGMQNVREAILNGGEQKLLIERRMISGVIPGEDALYYEIYRSNNKFSCIKNSVDELIEKVLENGGNVELVSNGLLHQYGRIALIKHFNKKYFL